jgi:pyruvate/2-oxoglutarate dehydrogenase complex dihydrolipoamide dehydrogenase (E3) component
VSGHYDAIVIGAGPAGQHCASRSCFSSSKATARSVHHAEPIVEPSV